MEIFDSLQGFLAWLTGASGGAFILVAWLASWLLEGTAWWAGITSQARSLIILLTAGAVGVAAALLAQFPQAVAAIDPFFRPVMYAVFAWLATQTAHKIDITARAKQEKPLLDTTAKAGKAK